MVGQILVRLAVLLLCVSMLMGRTDQPYWAESSAIYVTRVKDGVLSCGHATPPNLATVDRIQARISHVRSTSVQTNLAQPAADIVVNYTGFTAEAQAAFQRAVDIWASTLITTVPIEIDANFVSVDDLEDPEENEKTLAFASVSLWVFSEVKGQRFAVPILPCQSAPRP